MTAIAVEEAVDSARNAHVLRGQEIGHGLCLIRAVIHSPTYRIAIKHGQIKAQTEYGEQETVDEEKATKPSWKWNRHCVFKDIAANGREIQDTLERFSVPDVSTDRLVSVTRASELILAVDKLAETRREIVARIIDTLWYSEILPGLRDFFGAHFYQIRKQLPAPDETLYERYRVDTIVRPLTLVTPDGLDLSTLSQEESRRVVESQRGLIERMYRERFQTLFDTVFGGIHDLCLDITEGPVDPSTGRRTGKSALQSGHRKTEGLNDILVALDRVNDFKQFSSPEVLRMVNEVKAQISQATVQDINQNKGDNDTTKAIKAAMRPLSQAVKQLWDTQKAQANRSIRF